MHLNYSAKQPATNKALNFSIGRRHSTPLLLLLFALTTIFAHAACETCAKISKKKDRIGTIDQLLPQAENSRDSNPTGSAERQRWQEEVDNLKKEKEKLEKDIEELEPQCTCKNQPPNPGPTQEPVSEPTQEPVSEPTQEPIGEPTQEPVGEPTQEPIGEPTQEPVGEPTQEPVGEPTQEPVGEPTQEPAA
jgi:hypothetical protein